MTDTRNSQLCAGLVVVAEILVMIATCLISGDFGFDLIREGITLGLLIWLLTGSTIARWIVGTLSAIGFLVAIIGLGWFFIRIPNPTSLELDKWVSFAIVGFAALIYGFVSWRLLVRTRSTAYIKN